MLSPETEAKIRARLANNGRNPDNNNAGIPVGSGLHLAEMLLAEVDRLRAGPPPSAPEEILFWYTNHRGERGYRRVVPHCLRWGTSAYYPDPGLLLRAFDLEKNAVREFSVAAIQAPVGNFHIPFALPGAVELRAAFADTRDATSNILHNQDPLDSEGILVGVSRRSVDEIMKFMGLFAKAVLEGRI